MDERFPSDNGPDMTNHQENCNHTPAEVGWYTAVFVLNGSSLASQTPNILPHSRNSCMIGTQKYRNHCMNKRVKNHPSVLYYLTV